MTNEYFSTTPIEFPSSAVNDNARPFAARLLAWADSHGRKDLPWQSDKTPYRVWLSEIMLQQTQVSTVIPYFETFTSKYPSVKDLANADLDSVLHLWTGLGYYARCRNLYKCAQIIANEYDGIFPDTLDGLTELPGIGPSTAAAICSIAYEQPTAILDGNVKRVLTRYHAVKGWPGKPAVEKTLWEKARQHMPENRCADYTQAIMDLGATLCTRSKPDCASCPMHEDCSALAEGKPMDYPEKKPRKAVPVKSTYMLVVQSSDGILLEQRPASGIWGGLWSLPEFPDEQSIHLWLNNTFQQNQESLNLATFRHTFSHYHLDITPVLIKVEDSPSVVRDGNMLWYSKSSTQQIGLAAPVKKLIDSLSEKSL